MEAVNRKLGEYYTRCFDDHGASARGVDWHDAASLAVHYDKMLAVVEAELRGRRVSIFDIGCGYGGLLERATELGLDVDYTGIDLVGSMIEHGRTQHEQATFLCGDVFSFEPGRVFDYVVANGVLTEKLDVSIKDFGRFARRMVRRMFELADRGIAFNMMTSYVNFTAPNLYYQNPGEIISFCAAELSSKFVIDHAYQHYDFTMYLYK